MNAIAAPKSRPLNRFEGYALIAIFQGLPTFAAAVLMLKLVGDQQLIGQRYGAAIFVALAAPMFALLVPWLAQKFPKRFSYGYEPLLFDASLSFSEKIAHWRTRPVPSVQLLSHVILLSLLAVAVASVG
jgi:hypothetical protein